MMEALTKAEFEKKSLQAKVRGVLGCSGVGWGAVGWGGVQWGGVGCSGVGWGAVGWGAASSAVCGVRALDHYCSCHQNRMSTSHSRRGCNSRSPQNRP